MSDPNNLGAPGEEATVKGGKRQRRLGVVLPFVIFAAIGVLFFIALRTGDPSTLPSALIGKPVPQFDLPPLARAGNGGAAGSTLTSAKLGQGKPAIIHFFASWCAPCREEHPTVMALSKKLRAEHPEVPFYGINYKDDASAARRFLGGYGDPYTNVGTDRNGRAAINFGVYGVPELYVVGGDGTVLLRHAGPLTQDVVDAEILPLISGKSTLAEPK